MPASSQSSLVKALEASTCAAACVGPKAPMPARASAVDEAGGERRLGSDNDEIDLFAPGRDQGPPPCRGDRQRSSSRGPRCRGLPGAADKRVKSGLCAIFQVSACSRPPEPMMRTCMTQSYQSSPRPASGVSGAGRRAANSASRPYTHHPSSKARFRLLAARFVLRALQLAVPSQAPQRQPIGLRIESK